MKKNLLAVALVGALGVTGHADAQDYDDRWYFSVMPGIVVTDNSRNADNAPAGRVGFGRFFSPNWSLDLEANYANPEKQGSDLNWSQYGVGVTARYHFLKEGREWAPYVLAGAGWQRAEEEFELLGNPNSPGEREDSFPYGMFGGGLQADYGRFAIRTEIGYRVDIDDDSVSNPREDVFWDLFANIGLMVKFGPEPRPVVEEPPPPPPPPPPTCADLDDDGDGVNNCDDRCPNTPAGTAVGPDGCPVPLTIDLRGVNFDFDKATLRPDAIATLNEAIQILNKYPDLRVEVAGHTDLCGPESYNQRLSERRAKAVYDYLAQNGIGPNRMVGPTGYGETRPLEPTAQTFPGCKNERNRRTELNTQN